MKAILITSETPPVVIDIEERDGSTLAELQRVVGGNIEALPSPVKGREDLTTYINDESKFVFKPNPAATAIMAPLLFPDDFIAGPMLIMGFDPQKGVNLDCPDDVIATYTKATA